ncbi:hypothetical protein ABMA27_004212 [Loxostege sticticalis]|uniref:Lipase domain-containing protein n=1 Tax=Loxostege sticticalis TaxID=481309 RepID=A0ABR3HMR8_LOXSC
MMVDFSFSIPQTSLHDSLWGKFNKEDKLQWSRKTIVYVAGYTGNPRASDATALEAHYIKLGYNVWCLDEFFFYMTRYTNAAVLVRDIAGYVGKMLADLTQPGLLDPAKVEMISMSLGAHVMSPADRLDDSDADFVVVVVTNIDGNGMAAPVGHVNFYVNGGEFQVGDIPFIPCGTFCSHMKA